MVKTHPKVKVHNYFYRLRKSRGLTQKAVAVLLGHRTVKFISEYETGRRLPPLRTALALQVILGAEVSDIYLPLCRSIEQDVLGRTAWLPGRLRREVRSRLQRKDIPDVDT